MVKKINCYLCALLLLFTGCFTPENSDSDKAPESSGGGTEVPEDSDGDPPPKEEPKPMVNKPVLAEKDLGSIFFLGNSHTYNTSNLETMLKENGYKAKIYHIHTGGNVPLGNDYCMNNDEMRLDIVLGSFALSNKNQYMGNIFNRNHLSNLLEQKQYIQGSNSAAEFFPEDVSWIVVHDGSVYSSLTSAGAFMGLASAFGAKTACYQSWDLKGYSIYASKKFHLPMIPVGGVIHYPGVKLNNNNNPEYQINDGHMNNHGKYIYCVLFTHFFTRLPIDEIKGDGGLPIKELTGVSDKTYLTEENKKQMKELIKNVLAETDKIFADNKPYYECVKNFDTFSNCKSIEESKECTVQLQLGQPAIFNIPKGKSGKKLKVEVKSTKNTIIPDIWFYDAAEKKLTAQSTNTEYVQNYTFTGAGEAWETDGSKTLIVTRRGKTTRAGSINNSCDGIDENAFSPDSVIDESVDETVDFTVTVSFVD